MRHSKIALKIISILLSASSVFICNNAFSGEKCIFNEAVAYVEIHGRLDDLLTIKWDNYTYEYPLRGTRHLSCYIDVKAQDQTLVIRHGNNRQSITVMHLPDGNISDDHIIKEDFNQRIKIQIGYTGFAIALSKKNRRALRIYDWDETKKRWKKVS